MQINYLGNQHSVLHEFVAELRDVTIQHDRLRFRKNIERVGQIMAYEISKGLSYEQKSIQTPLGHHQSYKLTEQPVLATILRAGLSMHHGLLSFFDKADCAFISAYRKHTDAHSFDIVVEYLACPDIENRTLLLIDPMLATGQSIELTYKALLKRGTPSQLHIVCLLASRQGVDYLQQHLPHATLWLAAIDENLNEDGYIIPGLGDAGDLCFGEKV
ncbi:MAG: uracil phosphoribosyltransferase [Bacteroidota bacterium]|jgi:uracil phosphoribosyltransferase